LFAGCCGARNEWRPVLILYIVIVVILSLVMLIGGGYLMSADPSSTLSKLWDKLPNDVRVGVQYEFSCCGFDNTADMPGDPCPILPNMTSMTSNASAIDGCLALLLDEFGSFYDQAGLGAIIIGAFLLLMCMFSTFFLRSLNAHLKERASV